MIDDFASDVQTYGDTIVGNQEQKQHSYVQFTTPQLGPARPAVVLG